jgi:hypothetical protein
MTIAIADIEEDLRRSLAGVDIAAPNAAAATWRGFLEHAGRPVALEAPPHPDNDVLGFEVERPRNAPCKRIVRLERQIGIESADLEYLGTVVAACLWCRRRDRLRVKSTRSRRRPTTRSSEFHRHSLPVVGLGSAGMGFAPGHPRHS